MKIFLVAGARPNFMKIAPIVRTLGAQRPGEIGGTFYGVNMAHSDLQTENNNLRKSAVISDN